MNTAIYANWTNRGTFNLERAKAVGEKLSPKTVLMSIRHRTQSSDKDRRVKMPVDSETKTLIDIGNVHETFEVEPGAKVHLWCETISSDESINGAALLELRAVDSEGARRPIPGWGFVSTRVGEYNYLNPGGHNKPTATQITLRIPDNTPRLEVVGHQWKSRVQTAILGGLVLTTDERGTPVQLPSGQIVPRRIDSYIQQFKLNPGVAIMRIGLTLEGGKKSGKAPFFVQQYDQHGAKLLPMTDMPQHTTHGAFSLVETSAGKNTRVEIELRPAHNAALVELRGVEWGDYTPKLASMPKVDYISSSNTHIEAFLAEISDSDHLYVIDTTAPPLGHETLSLRPNNLAFEYAAMGKKVVFLPFSTIQDQSSRPHPGILQVNRDEVPRLIEWLSQNRRGPSNVYVCSSYPNHRAVTLIDLFKHLSWRTVYECRDDMEEFNRVGYSKWYDPMLERRVVESSDLVTAVSTSLASKLEGMTPLDVNVTVTPNGVRQSLIDDGSELRNLDSWALREESTVFGYVGHLTDSWFDWSLLIDAAARRPQYRFEIVGHGKPDWVTLPNNVSYLGPKPHDEMGPLVAHWRAGLIPFKDSPLTRSVDPNKIYEYFAWGLRCITTQMGSVEKYPSTWVYSTSDDFIASLDAVASSTMRAEELDVIERFLGSCSWNARALEFVTLADAISTYEARR